MATPAQTQKEKDGWGCEKTLCFSFMTCFKMFKCLMGIIFIYHCLLLSLKEESHYFTPKAKFRKSVNGDISQFVANPKSVNLFLAEVEKELCV